MRTTRCATPICGLLTAVIICSLPWILPGRSHGQEYVTGQVTSAILLQQRINLTVADKAIIDLGPRDGLIKGDVLVITPSPDIGLSNPIAECAVLSPVDDRSSVCQIISARMEIQMGNYVSMRRLRHVDEKFYPVLYNILSRTVYPYAPHKKINVYIHEIFDERNNVTGLSKRIKRGLEGIFSQKGRIRLQKDLDVKDFLFYPSDYRDAALALNPAMNRSGVDVFITGTYTVRQGAVDLTLYRFDRNYGDEGMAFRTTLTSPADVSEASEVVLPYRPIQKKEYVSARVTVKARQHVPGKDETGDIIAHEAEGDVFRVVTLKRTGFNIMSPVNIIVKLDNEKLNFSGKDDIIIPAMEKGTHKVSASFRRGYFANNRNSLLYSSPRDIEKEVLVTIDKEGDVFMEIDLDPSFDKENVAFRIYRQTETRRLLLKPIQSMETGRPVEFFKD